MLRIVQTLETTGQFLLPKLQVQQGELLMQAGCRCHGGAMAPQMSTNWEWSAKNSPGRDVLVSLGVNIKISRHMAQGLRPIRISAHKQRAQPAVNADADSERG